VERPHAAANTLIARADALQSVPTIGDKFLKYIMFGKIFQVMAGVALASLAGVWLTSCGESKEDVAATVNSWIGKKLVLPAEAGYFTTNGDSTDAQLPREKFTILRYISKEGCPSCKMHLTSYPRMLADLEDTAGCKVGFVCVINPVDMMEIKCILRRDNYADLTMWIDEADTLNTLNGFPKHEALQTFLLDEEHKVLAVGDPAMNTRVMNLYVNILTNDTINASRLPQTRLEPGESEIDLGDVRAGNTIVRTVSVKNVGVHEFVAEKVVTSCDCTTAELSAERIAPGGSATLRIRLSEEEAAKGDFYRTVDVFGNTPDPITIELSGKMI